MRVTLSDIDRARRAYLMAVAAGPDAMVHRSYLNEKVRVIFGMREVASIRSLCDESRARLFDRFYEEAKNA